MENKIKISAKIVYYVILQNFVYWKERRFLMKRFINDVKKFFNYTVFSSKAEL